MYTSIRADIYDYNEKMCSVYVKKERAKYYDSYNKFGSNTVSVVVVVAVVAATIAHNHIHIDTRTRTSKRATAL